MNKFKLKTLFPLIRLSALLVLSGCGDTKQINYGPGAYLISGSMHYLDIEGGCWQFASDSGESYELTGDKVSGLRREGVRAELIVKNAEGTASICMTGTIVQVLEIISSNQP